LLRPPQIFSLQSLPLPLRPSYNTHTYEEAFSPIETFT
jgi:hypothetical protein